MAFKMKGFNPGKGTGIGNGFSRVTLNPGTRDDPEGITVGNPDGMGGAVVEGETYGDLKKKKRDSRNDEIMFNNLTSRLEDYKNDPFKVEVGPKEAYKEKKGSMLRDWLLNNAKKLNEKYGQGTVTIKDGKVTGFKGPVEGLYNRKINEAINIDNDLKMSAEQGYGFNEKQLQNYGIYGMDEVGGKNNKVTTSLDDYAPNPQRQGNIQSNKENLQLEKVKDIGQGHMHNIKEAIKNNKNIPTGALKWLMDRGPQYDIPEFNQFIHNYVMPYQQSTTGKENRKTNDKLKELLASGKTIEQAYAELGISAPSTEGKIIQYGGPRGPGQANRLLDSFEVDGDANRYLFDSSPGLDLSSNNTENTDEITTMLDDDITGNETTTTNNKEKFDPMDMNKDGYVDKFDRKEYKKMMEEKNQNQEVTTESDGGGDGEGDGNEVVTTDNENKLEGDYNNDGVVDYQDKRLAPMAKWNNAKLQNMTKETLMNADKNPFKFGSKEHEEYINNKSRAKGLAIKQKYNKFL